MKLKNVRIQFILFYINYFISHISNGHTKHHLLPSTYSDGILCQQGLHSAPVAKEAATHAMVQTTEYSSSILDILSFLKPHVVTATALGH